MNTIRWGILGTGTMADLFVQALLSVPDAKVQAVAARTQERAAAFAAQYGIPLALEGYDRLIQDPAVDVVYISTPNEHHAEQCLKALSAGKAVLCEKPFALTAKEAADVIQLARSRGVFCMEAMWMRFSPAVREALSLAREGKLGTLEYFSGQLGFPYQEDPENRLFRQPGGGALLDLGVYPLSLAQALFGTPEKVIRSLSRASTGVDDQFSSILSYKSGAQAVISASIKAKLQNSASIHGRTSVLHLAEPLYFPESYRLTSTPPHNTKKGPSSKLAKLRRYPLIRTLADWRSQSSTRTISKRTTQSGYTWEALEVQRCLRAGLHESPEMPLADTLSVLESLDAIRTA
jgi:predicted dehydrogenase